MPVLLDCLANDFCLHLRTVRTNIKLGKAILQTDILCLQKCLCSSVPVIQSRPKISCLYSVSSSTTFIYKYVMINNCNAKRSLEHHSEKLYKVYGNVGLWHNEIGKKNSYIQNQSPVRTLGIIIREIGSTFKKASHVSEAKGNNTVQFSV